MNISLSDREQQVLTELCEFHDLNQSQLLRQALRLYQLVHDRGLKGEQLAFTKDGVVIPMHILSMMPPGSSV